MVSKTGTVSADVDQLSQMLKALAHPSRIAVMQFIVNQKDKRLTVKEIYRELKMPQPVISRHLGILKNAGLLGRSSEGINTFYEVRLNNRLVKQICVLFTSSR
jgi:DNA-binding transcriptional ArsR family regulator